METVADGGEYGINGVAGPVNEMNASDAVLGLEMTDHPRRGGQAVTTQDTTLCELEVGWLSDKRNAILGTSLRRVVQKVDHLLM